MLKADLETFEWWVHGVQPITTYFSTILSGKGVAALKMDKNNFFGKIFQLKKGGGGLQPLNRQPSSKSANACLSLFLYIVKDLKTRLNTSIP